MTPSTLAQDASASLSLSLSARHSPLVHQDPRLPDYRTHLKEGVETMHSNAMPIPLQLLLVVAEIRATNENQQSHQLRHIDPRRPSLGP